MEKKGEVHVGYCLEDATEDTMFILSRPIS